MFRIGWIIAFLGGKAAVAAAAAATTTTTTTTTADAGAIGRRRSVVFELAWLALLPCLSLTIVLPIRVSAAATVAGSVLALVLVLGFDLVARGEMLCWFLTVHGLSGSMNGDGIVPRGASNVGYGDAPSLQLGRGCESRGGSDRIWLFGRECESRNGCVVMRLLGWTHRFFFFCFFFLRRRELSMWYMTR